MASKVTVTIAKQLSPRYAQRLSATSLQTSLCSLSARPLDYSKALVMLTIRYSLDLVLFFVCPVA